MSAAREFPLAWFLGGLVVALAIIVAVLIRRVRTARAQLVTPSDSAEPGAGEAETIAALRLSEARTRESEARFRQLAESIASVFYLIARDGTVLYVSPAYDTVWERSSRSRYDSPASFLDAVHPEDRDHVLANYDRIFEQPIDLEYRIVMTDGRVKWIHDAACPVRDETGTVVRAAGSASDITAQRLLEGQLAQSSKLESLGRLAGGIAHDFNNLLTIILAQATLIEESVADAVIRDELQKIKGAADRAAVLTKQLLAFARRQIYEPRVVDLNEVVSTTEQMLRRLIGEDIELVTQTLSEPATVRVDPRGVEQVLVNLAVNARDAMPNGGTLRIELGAAAFTQHYVDRHAEATPGPCHVVTVADTGIGIESEHIDHVFEPFYTTKPAGQATGLGLATVYGFVRQSGGHVRLSSIAGRGTKVSVYLPRVPPQLPPPSVGGHAGPASGVTQTILLVEDEEGVRDIAARVLRRAGYRVLEAADGIEALELDAMFGAGIDLVLTDVVMPRLGGPELIRRLSARAPARKVLFTSGYSASPISETLEPGQSFLQKPYLPSTLVATVRALLEGTHS
jgi:two-component system, cell cycle sensor histidine kinase and response regulator CckA